MRTIRVLLAAAAALALTACFSDSTSNGNGGIGPTDPTSGNGAPPPRTGFTALFVPATGVFPYPIDLYFSGSTDGTLNIPSLALFPQRTVMNQLDGFSTTASSYFRMSQPVKNDAVMLNSNVRIIQAPMLRDPASGVYAPVGVQGVLAPGVDYSVRIAPETDAGGAVIEIVWLKPLAASTGTGLGTGYIVLVSGGLQNTSNTPATPDTDYLTVRTEAIAEIGRSGGNPAFVPTCPGITNTTLNAICRITYAQLAIGANPALGPAAVNPANVILSYSFTTQSTRDALVLMSQTHTAQPIAVVPTGFNTANLVPGLPGIADVYAGTVQVPYYLTPPSAADPTGPLTKPWTAVGASSVPGISATSRDITRFNLVPEKKADLKIPLLVFKPNGSSPSGGVKPPNGWPVVVFMHGLGGDRTNAVVIADTYAAQGFAVVAIDQVLHGITSTTNPLYAGPANPLAAVLYGPGVRERTFDVDYQNNATGAPGPDGQIDGSGRNILFIAASAPLVIRDGWRQSGSDLITLVKSLSALDLDGVPGGDIDLSQIHYSGISLGGIVGPACVCTEMKSYYLNVPGGPLPVIFRTSPTFAPGMNALLAGGNPLLQPSTSLYSQFFREMQAAIDAGDPSNYVRRLTQDRPVLFTKVIGDTVVPNPTNDFLINATGATKVTTAGLQPVAAGAPKFVAFLSGSHGSLLDPTASLAVTQEMQTHAASLVATGGAAFQVVNSSVLQQ
jgi:pimeloyl-ACP methyl ester carboxylesterase